MLRKNLISNTDLFSLPWLKDGYNVPWPNEWNHKQWDITSNLVPRNSDESDKIGTQSDAFVPLNCPDFHERVLKNIMRCMKSRGQKAHTMQCFECLFGFREKSILLLYIIQITHVYSSSKRSSVIRKIDFFFHSDIQWCRKKKKMTTLGDVGKFTQAEGYF